MTEAEHVWKPLRDGTRQFGVDWDRIENSVGSGMPDVNGCLHAVVAWIENKIIHGHRIKFRPGQPPWIARRVAHGGRVFILARKADEFRLYHGADVLRLVDQDIRPVKPMLVLTPPYDWGRLVDIVFGRSR